MQRRLTTILAADVVGYSRLAATDEEGTVSRLRALRHELIDPVIAAHQARTFKTTGDGWLTEFASVVDAVRAALEVQRGMAARNANIAPDQRIDFRVGIHLGDVIVEGDGDLMGDGVNIAARLESIAEPGGICLSSAAYDQVRDKIAAEFTDLGERELKNIARPVRVFSIAAAAAPHRATLRVASPPPAGGGRLEGGLAAEQGPPRLSIVVLPFANIGGDPEQEYFVDGLTEDLTTELSRIPGAFVIARNTAFTYKGKPFDVKQIGRDLNVRYVLEGSVRRSGNRVRVNVQLIDAESGAHLWADRFDREIEDLFDLQDALTIELANVLGARLVETEGRKSVRSARVEVEDLILQARAVVNRGPATENTALAQSLFEKALSLDSNSIGALAGLGSLLAVKVVFLMSGAPERDMARAEELATQTLRIDANNLTGHFTLGLLRRMQNRFDEARNHMEAVIRINPNSRLGHSELGWLHTVCGRAEDALPYFEKSRRLSSRDQFLFIDYGGIGWVYFVRRDYDRAIEYLRQSVSLYPSWIWSNVILIAACSEADRIEEARDWLAAYLRTNPIARSIAFMRANAVSRHPDYVPQVERVYDGLRKAGMPEE